LPFGTMRFETLSPGILEMGWWIFFSYSAVVSSAMFVSLPVSITHPEMVSKMPMKTRRCQSK
jgi:hypothetical protein